jgi:hypothetical protein
MTTVYEHAEVTIAAADAPHCDANMWEQRTATSVGVPANLQTRRGAQIGNVLLAPCPFEVDSSELMVGAESGHLSTRGWTLQERILSTRVLSIGQKISLWHCKSSYCHEAIRFPIKRDRTNIPDLQTVVPERLENFTREQLENQWFSIMVEYGSRKLTYGTDLLPALAGLAAEFQSLLEDDYIAGLWRRNIARGLAWQATGYAGKLVRPRIPEQAVQHMPSWGWASVQDTLVTYDLQLYTETSPVTPDLQFLEVQLQNTRANAFGAVVPGASLKVRGKSVVGYIRPTLSAQNGFFMHRDDREPAGLVTID